MFIFIKKTFISIGVVLTVLFSVGSCGVNVEEKNIQITTSSAEAMSEFLKGRDLFEKLRQQESLQFFENAIGKDKKFAMAYYYHSLANPTNKGFFEDLDNAVALTDNISEGERLIILALKSAVDGNQKQQEEYLIELVELYPDDKRAHGQLGQFYFGQQKYQLAVDHLSKSTTIAPDYSLSYNMLGYSYRNLGNYSEAEKSFKKYIELIPDDPNPYDSYAELLLKMGRYEESIKQYKKALSIDPNFIASHIGIATNLNYLEQYKDARKQCKVCFDLARNDGEKRAALFSTMVSYVNEGEYDKALEVMEKQYSIAEANVDAGAMAGDLNIMGNILFEAGNYGAAKNKYEKSVLVIQESNLSNEVKENNKRFALYNQGRISLMIDDLNDAKSKATEFSHQANLANNTFQIWFSHDLNGMVAMKEKQYQEAINEFKQANQQNPYILFKLANAYQENDNKNEAKKYYEKCLNFNALNSINQAFIRTKVKEVLASM